MNIASIGILVSSLIFIIIYCSKTLSDTKSRKYLGLNLSRNEVIVFFIFEFVLFYLVYASYMNNEHLIKINDGFAWMNLFTYGRGVFVGVVITSLFGEMFQLEHAIYPYFLFHLVFDYLLLYFLSKIGLKKQGIPPQKPTD